jgi:hypothetical protein
MTRFIRVFSALARLLAAGLKASCGELKGDLGLCTGLA